MRHFIIELTYTMPIEQFGDALPAHRVFLTAAYDQRWILVSGPQVPRTGGVIIARAPSLEALMRYMADDPLKQRGLATYRYIEFDPVRYQPQFEGWVTSQES